MANVAKWYVLDESSNPTGPLSTKALAEKLQKGDFTREALCWCEGREIWQCAEDIAEIQAALGAVQPQPKRQTTDAALEKAAKETSEEERFVDDDGTLYVWNAELKKYEPKSSYEIRDMTFGGHDEVVPSLEDTLKREQSCNVEGKRKTTENPSTHWSDPKKTTSVYVTGLPLDVTVEEIVVVFSKCGVLKEDDDGVRIKIYKDKKTGLAKGDGLVTYMKRPSVELAINILNGTPFRDNQKQTMTIQEAKFEMKGEQKSNKKHKSSKSKKGAKEDKLLGWGGFDDHLSSHKITVILHNMFHPMELQKGQVTKEELKEDVEMECSKLGEVDRVVVYEENEAGIVSVRFRSEEAADACVQRMHQRYFSQRQIQAHKWDGYTKYHRPQKATTGVQDEEERLEQFARDLERS